MKTFKYIAINLAFLLFFVYENSIHPFIFNGLFFILFFVTVLCLFIMIGFAAAIMVESDSIVYDGIHLHVSDEKNWYYIVDAIFDIIMIFIMVGNDHYIYAVFYVLTNISAYILRQAIRAIES